MLSVFDEFSLGHFDAIVMRFLTSLHFSRTLSRYCPAVFDEFAVSLGYFYAFSCGFIRVCSDSLGYFYAFSCGFYEFASLLSDILTLFLAVFTSLRFLSDILTLLSCEFNNKLSLINN